ncbi:hypothetical protein JCM33374_g6433 [Metschnikowia sp. JCM 33374]|nr:hypothetical protein JCM33374_g6433 [Metschnikowia sp. JCM 33374]
MFPLHIFSAVCLFAVLVAAGIDPYAVLGVARDADEKTIKSQYRQLSKQYHPDKNPDPEAHEKFIEVGEAYGILNDAEKRHNYDQYGDVNGPQHQGDPFNQFFNGGHPGFGGQQQQRRGPDTQVIIHLSLQEFYLGKDADFGVQMQNICETCTGSGSADGKRKKCSKCKGSGVFVQTVNLGFMVQHIQSPCDQCQGSGSVIAKKCKTCGGAGAARAHRQYNVFVQPGTPKNHVHVLEGEGDQNPDWVSGNLNLRMVESQYDNWGFRRIGDNLYRTEVLTAKEATLGGWNREIAFFDDEFIDLKREKGQVVIDGQVDVITGHGMPSMHDHDEHGNLFIEYKVLPVGKGAYEKDEL